MDRVLSLSKWILILITVLFLFLNQIPVFAEGTRDLPLKSESAVLLDSETNAVLYGKNADEKMYPASVTKIATAIYAIEKGDLDSISTVSANAVRQDGTRVYLVEGEQVPLKKLIQGMLINSGNDAAVAIAEHIDGSVDLFAEHINEYLKTVIGVKNTHFTNPSGLHDDNHYTTAMDLALITNYAMKNPQFAEIFGTKRLHWEGQSWNTDLITHHLMLKGELPYAGITGGKTGYTTVSKQTLATTADNGNLRLTAIVLKSDQKRDKYDDTAILFDYGFNEYVHSTLKHGEVYKSGDQEFLLDRDLLVTEDKSGIVKKVDSTGRLSIENPNGQVLQVAQLKQKEEPKPVQTSLKSSKSTNKQEYTASYFWIFIVAAAAVLIGAGKKITGKM